jgi:hypothetical protein
MANYCLNCDGDLSKVRDEDTTPSDPNAFCSVTCEAAFTTGADPEVLRLMRDSNNFVTSNQANTQAAIDVVKAHNLPDGQTLSDLLKNVGHKPAGD